LNVLELKPISNSTVLTEYAQISPTSPRISINAANENNPQEYNEVLF
jgi:hypothetical protein